MNEALQRLEEKIAYLEHHVTAQDKVMLEMGDEIARLKREMKLWIGRVATMGGAGESSTPMDEERPPHY